MSPGDGCFCSNGDYHGLITVTDEQSVLEGFAVLQSGYSFRTMNYFCAFNQSKAGRQTKWWLDFCALFVYPVDSSEESMLFSRSVFKGPISKLPGIHDNDEFKKCKLLGDFRLWREDVPGDVSLSVNDNYY